MNKEIQNEQELEKASEDKNGIVTWIKAHKKQLVFIGISIPTLIDIVLGLKNKDAIKELFDNKVIESLEEIEGVGHRVVHGGSKYATSVVIDEDVVKEIKSL